MVTGSSQIWAPWVMDDIHSKAELGRYRIRGFSSFQNVTHFDDLTFLSTGLTRFPLEGYKERCNTRTIIGGLNAEQPLVLETPIYISGMSYGALSANAKIALGKAATMIGSASCTGDGGMLQGERDASDKLVYQVLPSRYGFNPHHLAGAQAVEIVVGQGAKPGTGGMLMGIKVQGDVAEMRDLPQGIDQRSPARHPDWLGPDDLAVKIEQIREATDWRVPVHVKLGACRVDDDVKLAAKAGADAIVIDSMVAGTGASAEVLIEHSGIPTVPAIVMAREALRELGLYGKVSLIASGGIRHGADAAKALALGADAVAIGLGALIALNCNKEIPESNFPEEIGVEAGLCHHCHTGKCPVGIATQDPLLTQRLDPDEGAERVANYINSMTMEMTLLTRSLGKSDVHSLEPEDLAALTLEASAMARIPLVGTNKVFGE
ncbi:MAG: FMN-binding glutamate synthase family protein [SAR202 cluster bacterium]|uniref:Glutamate synthase [NADPH] large chain n=1 Tax=hydrothermal vent metagenome TaxID=652676 RepID=A0A160V8Z6_9ZZZZ|nr:FMN-binding glutamate synthase family protein [Dehalococcoidia bacterium]MQF92266.1 FMN-binding glutamate synthase family protein [SAR202 cluster bacterium]MQG13848.1 FMN-binding glutamate synthase family protein [SAR202 cluster bacterium]MQG40639.1 FMN-binding glutamate synthase family protein [SAR202 cluster bacterium]MQG62760.1 FMN-binding glutamate synthase family protein [SAR202 cluster bacterium]